ncbi:chemotaxis protein CheV [Campylobacter sp. Cr9]|uniref:chemotaxis protein n=1 Tax=unclassified Campylobacter TaxID=2593542 RepID=UPI001EFA65D8|nr:chemotaxis protein [Campylobacter sp. RM5004]MBZ7985653.1 chemotaxis protein CheV [Campylobacter sp. Cr9]ULO01885.1 chemotaxis signal transduction protein CheV [Campylobacter sp. RM5004]
MAEDKVLKADSNEMELVDFRIYKQGQHKVYEGIYGVNVAKVKEIIKIPALTELPGVPEYIEGVFDLRGVVIPVINLAKWMNIIEPKDMVLKPRIIIAEFSNIMIGFIVHEAKRIRRISATDIRGSDFSTNTGGFDKSQITGIAKIENDEVLLILDLERIVEELGIYSPKIDIEEKEIKKMTGTAVVLDDSSTARKLVRDALDKMGFKVIEAKDGVDGLNKMNELYDAYKNDIANQVKVIISDVEMPQMDGFHFASRVREDIRFKGIPIIFNSSLSNEFSTLKSKDVGGDAFLTKFDANIFYKEVSRVIESYINK